jgi:UDPglucose 6-dehydrogenase
MIGIIGLGFVGTAVRNAYDITLLEHDPGKNIHATYDELRKCQAIFVCVPSPPNSDGSCNTSFLENVLDKLHGMEGTIISKVTAPPEEYRRLQTIHPNLVHVPEFLVAATANDDYKNETMTIIGGSSDKYIEVAKKVICLGQKKLHSIRISTIEEAAMTKYTLNTFLALKVAYLNQIYEYTQSVGIDFSRVMDLATSDVRFGYSHTNVPGPDGQRGFGGACFPKDCAALIAATGNMSILEAACKYNDTLRNK